MTQFILIFILITSFLPMMTSADETRIAVASNFIHPIEAIAQQFQAQNSDKVIIIAGSTGRIYAQIMHGAPFDAFFSADRRRPLLLEQQGIALANSRFTYAQGKIALFSPKANNIKATKEILKQQTYQYLAIANPKLAPYGRAAQQVLEKLQLWDSLQPKIVRGENIGQAYQFVMSGNAELGFVALSQIKQADISGSYWEVPTQLYQPIKQQAVLLSNNRVAKAFLKFVQTDEAKTIINHFGYEIP